MSGFRSGGAPTETIIVNVCQRGSPVLNFLSSSASGTHSGSRPVCAFGHTGNDSADFRVRDVLITYDILSALKDNYGGGARRSEFEVKVGAVRFSSNFAQQFAMVLCDVPEPNVVMLSHLNQVCMSACFTLVLCWSYEEVAQTLKALALGPMAGGGMGSLSSLGGAGWVDTLKSSASEKKPPGQTGQQGAATATGGRDGGSSDERSAVPPEMIAPIAIDALVAISSISRNDAVRMINSGPPTIAELLAQSGEAMAHLPGFGAKKKASVHNVLTADLRPQQEHQVEQEEQNAGGGNRSVPLAVLTAGSSAALQHSTSAASRQRIAGCSAVVATEPSGQSFEKDVRRRPRFDLADKDEEEEGGGPHGGLTDAVKEALLRQRQEEDEEDDYR